MAINKFNRGEIDEGALARDDVKKVRDSASLVENFVPKRLGPMTYRPGTKHLDSMSGESYCIPFVAATNDTAILEFSNGAMRVWVDDALITRTSVTSTITNGEFTSNITGWTDNSGAGSSTSWQTGGYASLTGATSTTAVLYQTIGSTQTGAEHALRVVVDFGNVTLKLGTSGASSSDIYSGTLGKGTHSLVFTPGSNVTITFENSRTLPVWIDSVEFESTGTFSLPVSVTTSDIGTLRHTQSVDVVFLTHQSLAPFKVERRGTKSWSIADYVAEDGPFGVINTGDVTLTPAALSGITTLTASRAYFTSDDVGTLFRLESTGQTVTAAVTAEDSGTGNILVTGVSGSRNVSITVSGTFSATITLQRSVDESSWEDVKTYTSGTTENYTDGLDNAELYYRLWCKSGDYTSGTANLTMVITSGSISGVGIVKEYNSSTSVDVGVLKAFGATDATRNWYRGLFSAKTGYPTACYLYESRLFFAGKNKLWGTLTDNYFSFDDSVEGNSAAISRTIGFGPGDNINWISKATRLCLGLAGMEITVRSSSFGESLTNSNVNLKDHSTQGSASIDPAAVDDNVYFVQRSLNRIYELDHDPGKDAHFSLDTSMLNPDICAAGIKRMAVVRQPETRIYVVLNNGEVRTYLLDRTEDVRAWTRMTTDGTVEDVVSLPGTTEDELFFVVNRDNGRYLEKQAMFSESIGSSLSVHFDSAVVYSSPGTATLTGLTHLNGMTVGVWADGADKGDYTVASNQITIDASTYTNVVVGLRYTATWTSGKLSEYKPESVLNVRKRVYDVALVLQNYLTTAITLGPELTNMYPMPAIENGKATSGVVASYDEIPFPFDGADDTDPRINIRSTGPCTILALSYGIDEVRPRSKNDQDR